MFDTVLAQFNTGLMLLVCGLAMWKGDRQTRAVGVAVMLGWLAGAASDEYFHKDSPLYLTLVIDTLLLLVLGVVSYLSPRNWPVAATILQALGLVAHVSYVFDVSISVLLYYWALSISAYGVVFALLFGTVGAWLERRALSGPREVAS